MIDLPLRHPVVIMGATFLALVIASRAILRAQGADVLAAAAGNPSGTVPYVTGAAAMGPLGGLI